MMLQYFGYIIFILSVAMAAGGIVLCTRLRSRYQHDIFSILLYFQVFIYTFGFYGIWGQAVIKAILTDYISPEQLAHISDIAMLLGLPFLVFAWLMLLRFSSGLSGRNTNSWFVPVFLLLNFSVVVIVGFFLSRANEMQPVSLIKNYYLVMNFLYSAISSIMILSGGKKRSVIHNYDRKIIASAIFMIMILQGIPLLFYKTETFIAIIFILIFFAGNTFLPVYLSYGIMLLNLKTELHSDLSFEEFCKKFEVSPRETDIIREICNGLSNKEIAGKLFISLQTVKDHTHRIYIKTNVRSRVQLINLVQEMKIL
jgi:DNA-binding CsgD family transcriptional regulator